MRGGRLCPQAGEAEVEASPGLQKEAEQAALRQWQCGALRGSEA